MDRLKELKEARTAAVEVRARIDNAINSLDSASSWGILDIFGGGFFSSVLKRERIQDANYDVRKIFSSLKVLNRELEDVNMTLPNQISDTMTDSAFDIWFDNIFTDIRVQGEIKESLGRLRDFRITIVDLIKKLDAEIESIE